MKRNSLIMIIIIALQLALAQWIMAAPYDIILDPGHGGTDPGTIGIRSNGDPIYEKGINLQVGLALKFRLDNEFPDMISRSKPLAPVRPWRGFDILRDVLKH